MTTPAVPNRPSWLWWFLLGPVLGAVAVAAAGEIGRVAFAAPTPRPHSQPIDPNGNGGGSSHGRSNCNFNGGNNSKNDCSTHIEERQTPLPPSLQRIVLTPASDAPMESACAGDKRTTQYRFIFGSNVTIVDDIPQTVLAISGRPLIQIARSNGRISITKLLLFDNDGHNIADITDDKIWINPLYEAALTGKNSGLVIFDQNAREFFRIKYANKRDIIVSGIFRLADNPVTVLVTKSEMDLVRNGMPAGVLAGMCAYKGRPGSVVVAID